MAEAGGVAEVPAMRTVAAGGEAVVLNLQSFWRGKTEAVTGPAADL